MRYNATLFFKTEQAALDAGYCDAVYDEDDVNYPYSVVITFFCDDYYIEKDNDLFEVAV